MKVMKKLVPLAAASTLALTALATPVVYAETSASLGVANMYLWRGQNLSPNGGQVSGELKYSDKSGAYAGIWTSSEDAGSETDLFFGYSGKAGDIGYDVSYWNYLYPSNRPATNATDPASPQVSLSENDAAEIVLGISYMDFSASYFIQVDSDNPDDNYLTLTYSKDKYSLTYGMWMLDNGSVAGGSDEYSHLTLTYAATDALAFTVSKAFSDLDTGTDGSAVEEDFLVQVSYGWSFDIK